MLVPCPYQGWLLSFYLFYIIHPNRHPLLVYVNFNSKYIIVALYIIEINFRIMYDLYYKLCRELYLLLLIIFINRIS